ncbi:uncharacterized protein LOC112345935 [Selaginella moellendorffii]|uniref:uncharacterized protein LOC112345935 n=1 Tax=Selaginella moellendorffii TaxID=88036 RepID=UPI000D1CB6E0|nr:uncharacterized protein LOC112345935 [Selaginella moellendorffii]|eukprot:XP_024529467.1 uncharacterized protein LOC112345935 [Selaginella moellendorffii]
MSTVYFQQARDYILRGGDGSCGIIISPDTVATYLHDNHTQWVVGQEVAFYQRDGTKIKLKVSNIHPPGDTILLKSAQQRMNAPDLNTDDVDTLCGAKYMMIGLSGKDAALRPREGILQGAARHGPYMIGSSGSSKGDSGGGVFDINNPDILLGMNIGHSPNIEYAVQDCYTPPSAWIVPSGLLKLLS